MKTIRELATLLSQYDEITVLELLEVTSEDLVEAFLGLIEERQDYIRKALDVEHEEDEFNNDEEGDY